MTIVFYIIQQRGRLRTLIPGYTCSHLLCVVKWASNWIYLSPVLNNVKEKTVISLLQIRKLQSSHHPPHRDYLHSKKSTRITPTGRICRIISFVDGLNLPFVWSSEILKNPACILKLFPPLFQSSRFLLLSCSLIVLFWKSLAFNENAHYTLTSVVRSVAKY